MNVELRKVKTCNGRNGEGAAFSADVYLDGKLIGHVSNGGCGGPNSYQWRDVGAGKRVNQWARERYPQYKYEQLDHVVGRLIDRIETRKRLARMCGKQTLFRLAGDARGGMRTVRAPYSQAVAKYLHDKYPDTLELIANENLDAAVAFMTDGE